MSSSIRKIMTGVALLATASQAYAGDWKHEIAPYLWGSAMDGTVGIGGVTQKGRNGLLQGDIDMDQIGLAADFGYALSEPFTLLAGLRYTDLETQIKASGPLGNTLLADEQQSWVDPVIGAKVSWPLAER